MLVALTLKISTLETAEQLDSQFQIDFEAILNEARQLKQKLLGLKDQIDSLLGEPNLRPICDEIDLVRDGVLLEGSDDDIEGSNGSEVSLNTLLNAAKNQ